MRRIITTLALVPALAIGICAQAQAWHGSAQIICPTGGTTVTAKFQYVFPSGGPWTAEQQIIEVNTKTDQWPVIARQNASGYGSALTPNSMTVQQPLDGKPHTYVAKTFWDNGDEGYAKSPVTVCAPLVPVPGCDGQMYPPGAPLPVCLPPVTPVAAPPVPETPVAPPTPPAPPAPRCVGPYHIAVSKGATLVKVRFVNKRGKVVRANYLVNGRERVKNQRVLKYSHRQWRSVKAIRARHALFPRTVRCGAFKRVVHKAPPRTPRFAG